jgi:hypothetical protein
LEQVMELDDAARSAFLVEACGEDLQLREVVESLLYALPGADTADLFPPLPLEALQPFGAAQSSRPRGSSASTAPVSSTEPGVAATTNLRRDDQLGRYRLLEQIGAGGMGTVHAAYDTVLGRKIALKFLSAPQGEKKTIARLIAEAGAMARLSHPNVVTVHDVGILDGHPFVAMEYVTGVTLSEWRRMAPRSVREIVTVMAAVARGLEAAHAVGIVHRDVKPSNILVDGPRVLVTDFGLSVADGRRGRVAGTPGYMAPEQMRGEPATPATDVFGFCATLFEMLHLQLPFGTGSLAEIQTRMQAGQRAATRPGVRVPKRLERLLDAGLRSAVRARPASMAAIATTLLADPARFARRCALGVAMTALVVLAFWAGWRHSPEPESLSHSPAGPQVISGPAWVQPAETIPATMFGVTIQSATGAMPSFRVGAVRLWDSGTTWASIEPRRGEHAWATLDRLVDAAARARRPVLFTLGGTPAWAAAAGVRSVYEDGSRASPPDDLTDWEAFCAALARRYGERIEAYEVWVLGNDARFYAGSVERLVEMTRIAYRVIKAAAPGALVACPGMGRLWTADGQQFLRRFAELGGYQHCDVASIKLYQRSPSDPPESMLELVHTVDRILHTAGVHPPLWNTGTTYEIPLQGSLDEVAAVNHAVRFFLVGIYARMRRMYFYNWGGTKIPIVLQAVGGAPTAAALAVEQLQRWLESAGVRSCGRGPAIGLPENVWQCEFTITSPRPFDAAIRWTDHGSRVTTAPRGSAAVHRLDKTRTPLRTGDPLLITGQPVLVEYGASEGTGR